MHHTIKHDVNYKDTEGKLMGKRGVESSHIRKDTKNVKGGFGVSWF